MLIPFFKYICIICLFFIILVLIVCAVSTVRDSRDSTVTLSVVLEQLNGDCARIQFEVGGYFYVLFFLYAKSFCVLLFDVFLMEKGNKKLIKKKKKMWMGGGKWGITKFFFVDIINL